jgi:hypothetical protein
MRMHQGPCFRVNANSIVEEVTDIRGLTSSITRGRSPNRVTNVPGFFYYLSSVDDAPAIWADLVRLASEVTPLRVPLAHAVQVFLKGRVDHLRARDEYFGRLLRCDVRSLEGGKDRCDVGATKMEDTR